MKSQLEVQYTNQASDFLPLSTLSPEISVDQICKFYHYRYNSKFSGRRERHDGYEFFYVASGSMRVMIEDTLYILNTNEYILIPPMKWHQISSNKVLCSSMSICFLMNTPPPQIHLILENVATLSKQEQKILEFIGIEYIDNMENDGYFIKKMTAFSKQKNDYAFFQALKNQMEYLVILIVRDFLQHEEDQSSIASLSKKETDFSKNVLAYIDEHIAENISSKDLATYFKYSPAHFGRIFKQATGETVTSYILKAKIQKAMLLFASEPYTVQYVSDYLNFGCVQYFSKIFKRYTGLSPIEFKQNCMQTNLMSTAFLMHELV
jgi:AraC-like DNA-binding protein